MRKILTFSAVVMMCLVVFAGCSKKSSSSTPSYTMKATVGTTSFTAANCVASNVNGLTAIIGWAGTSSTPAPPYIEIYLTGYNKTTGTFSLTGALTANYASYYENSTTASVSTTGTLTIASASTTSIVGSFSFTTTDGTVVSNGTFTAKGY